MSRATRRALALGVLASTAIALAAGAGCDTESADVIGEAPSSDAGKDATSSAADGNPSEDVPDAGVADVGTPEADPPDGSSNTLDVDASDATAASDAADATDVPLTGALLASGANLTLVGVTSQAMVIYSDGTSYLAVPTSGGTPTVLTPMAGVTSLLIQGAFVFAFSSTTPLAVWTGCPTCASPFGERTIPTTGLSSLWNFVVAPDDSGFAFTAVTVAEAGTPSESLFVYHAPGGNLAQLVGNAFGSPSWFAPVANIHFLGAGTNEVAATYGQETLPMEPTLQLGVFKGDANGINWSTLFTQKAWPVHGIAMTTSPSGEWVYSFQSPLPCTDAGRGACFGLTHVPDGTMHSFSVGVSGDTTQTASVFNAMFDAQDHYFYINDPGADAIERVWLKDFSTTVITTTGCTTGILALSPDGNSALCGAGLVSLPWGVFTLLPASMAPTSLGTPVPNQGFTDDWSLFYWTATPDGGDAAELWASPVGGSSPLALQVIQDTSLFTATSLSNATLLVRNGGTVSIVDATGHASPIVAADDVAPVASAWALSGDRKWGAYVTPTGLYSVGIP